MLAQSRESNPVPNQKPAVERNTQVQSDAAVLGTVEVNSETKKQQVLPPLTRVIEIEPAQKVRLLPGPALPGEVGPAGDRGVQVLIGNP